MGTFTPLQQNWRWYENDGAEPTAAYQGAAENAKPTMDFSFDPLRLRVCIKENNGAAGGGAVSLEYSTNDSTFTAFGAGNHWNYYDGAATEGNTVTGLKLTDSVSAFEYCESRDQWCSPDKEWCV